MGFLECSGISWTIRKQSAPHSGHITTPTPHHSYPFNGPFSGTTWASQYQTRLRFILTILALYKFVCMYVCRKVGPIWILLKQETVSGSGIRWAICKSAPRYRQITTPAPHHSVFTGQMPFLLPNQQRQSAEGNSSLIIIIIITRNHRHLQHFKMNAGFSI